MINRHSIWTIAKKEMWGFLNSPLSFIIIVPFLFISSFIYLRTSVVVGEASMRSYFELLPWFLILLAPALSMKLITEEKSQGTLELLHAHPLSEIDIVVGKFFGAVLFYLVIIATTLPIPIGLLIFANPDPGVIASQYIGGILLGSFFLSIGIAASTYVVSPIGSFLLAAAISFCLLLLGLDFVSLLFPPPFNTWVSQLAVHAHIGTIARGALDIRDVLYFLSGTLIMLLIAVMKLSERKTEEDPSEKRKVTISLWLMIGIGVLANIFLAWFPLRVDLTQQQLFTLSAGTKKTIQSLPDIVSLTLYTSSNLPGPMQLTLKEVQDMIRDYARYGEKIQVSTKYTDTDPSAASDAQTNGIQEVTFNKLGSGKFEVQTGMLGLAMRYGTKTERIPYIQDTTDLEYQITRRIRKLVSDQPTTVGIYSSGFSQQRALDTILETEYTIKQLTLEQLQKKEEIASLSALIVVDDGSSDSSISAALSSAAEQTKRLMILGDGVHVNTQAMTGTKGKSTINDFLSLYGIRINSDLVYDLELNETLTFGGNGQVRYVAPYPFWLRALISTQDTDAFTGIKSVTLGWPSSLDIQKKDGITQKTILTTSKNAGKQQDNFQVDPTKSSSLSAGEPKEIPLGVSIEKGSHRLVVIADSDVASDQMLQNFAENASFLISALDSLLADSDVSAIPKKSASRAVYRFTSPIQPIIFQYGTMILPSVAVIAFGIYWLSRRKKLTQRKLVIKS